MPPRTRTRGAKALKENADVENNYKTSGKVVKSTRKALADKTNSLSEHNESVSEIKKVSSKLSLAIENNGRPRRQKRLPTRFKENQVLNNLSKSQNNSTNSVIKSVETAKKGGGKQNVQKCNKRPALESRQKGILGTNIKKDNPPVNKDSETQEKDSFTIKDKCSHNKIKSFSSDSVKNVKVVHNKKAISTAKRVPEQKKLTEFLKATTNKGKQIQKDDISELKDTSPNTSKTSEKLQKSKTFTPPSNTKNTVLERSLLTNRPKRIHRLPSRFDDHSISPSKYIPVQPCHASTPLQKKLTQTIQSETKYSKINRGKNKDASPKAGNNSSNKTSPDSNNNPKTVRSTRLKSKTKMLPLKRSPRKVKIGKRLLDESLSFKILDDKKTKDDSERLDVYEFTFNPDEEPQPQKKKKKRVVNKKPAKPKTVVFRNNYDKNISKAMAALKDAVAKYVHPSKKDIQDQNKENSPQGGLNIESNSQAQCQNYNQNNIQSDSNKPQNFKPATKITETQTSQISNVKTKTKETLANDNKLVYENPPSIRIEDIEADCEISYHDDINYSPVNSPRPSSLKPMAVTQYFDADNRRETIERAIHNKDPLNLQDDISFFDDLPVASSSMNVSVRHPLASPWRVEFGRLPIKWQANTYLKPNMTPAVENSFISSEDSNKKKHVYVNMVPETNDSLPQIVENTGPNLKQASIISFMKEVAERNANKKKRKSVSPIKASALFEDVTNKVNSDCQTSKKGPNKAVVEETTNKNVSNTNSNTSDDKENVRVTRKRKNENAISKLPAKSPRKEKDNNVTYFGFDDSENQDQENVVPNKNIDHNKVRALRSRSRVLQEINGQNEATKAILPLAAKTLITPSSDAIKRMCEELKSAEDAPQFLEKDNQQNAGTTNVEISQNVDIDTEDNESVHLFEDIDVVHHLKPTRKSYGKAKKVTFRQRSTSDSEIQASDVEHQAQSSDEDDLGDLTFTMPKINQKKTVRKKKTKKLMSKKEEKEADEWAAGFNSMCEDIEEFPLVVE